jgi:phosphatidylinositol alpha-1,6-mannosyltransferase
MRLHEVNTEAGWILITHEYAPFRGGVATYCEELAAALRRAGRPVEVWAPGFSRGRLRRGSLRLVPMLRFGWEILRQRQRLRPATVLLASAGAHMIFFVLGPVGVLRCGRLGSVLHGSELLRFARNPLWRFLARRAFGAVQQVFAPSQFSASLVERSFLSRPATVAACGCSAAARQPVAATAGNGDLVRILTLARLHPRKGQLDVARALALLPGKLKWRVVYRVAGAGDGGYLPRVRRCCERAGVRFEYLGEIDPGELAATYAGCEIFVMASRSLPASVEGFGISYLEAAYHGKPCVGYRTGGVSEAVVDGVSGLLVEEGDVEALAGAIERLIADEQLRRRMGEAGRAHAARFCWEGTARVVLEVLEREAGTGG